jgi:Sugar phosphate permease
LSYLFGDIAARRFMGRLIGNDVGWRVVFLAAADVMLVILLANLLLLKESPHEIGETEPQANPLNLVDEHEGSSKAALKWALTAFLRSSAFWIVCLLSLGMTLLRETFNTWTSTYFIEVAGLSKAEAASENALFHLFGVVSVLLAGFISDKLGRNGRTMIILIRLLLSSAGLWLLGHTRFGGSPAMPVWLVASVAFTLIAPYSHLAGAISLDFGGKQGSATASGVIDGLGYLGGVLAGGAVASVSADDKITQSPQIYLTRSL